VKTLGRALFTIYAAFFESGQSERAAKVAKELKELAEHTGQPNTLLNSMLCEAATSILDGHLKEAAVIARQVRPRGEELGIGEYATSVAGQVSVVFILLGSWEEIPGVSTAFGLRTWLSALCAAHSGRREEAIKTLDWWFALQQTMQDGSVSPNMPPYGAMAYMEAAILVGHKPVVELVMNKLAASRSRVSPFIWSCVPRRLGQGAAFLGRHDEARRYYQEAIKICTEMKLPAELALTRLGLAELLLEHYPNEKKEALEHLDFAINEFREMKMQPSLERALRHKDILKA
jgi:tetratricopeptide (TPR) repeat protein